MSRNDIFVLNVSLNHYDCSVFAFYLFNSIDSNLQFTMKNDDGNY